MHIKTKSMNHQVRVFLPLSAWVLMFVIILGLSTHGQAAPTRPTAEDGTESVQRLCRSLGHLRSLFKSCWDVIEPCARSVHVVRRETCGLVSTERMVTKFLYEEGQTIVCSASVLSGKCRGRLRSTVKLVAIESTTDQRRHVFQDLISTQQKRSCCVAEEFQTKVIQLPCSRPGMTVPVEMSSAVTCSILPQ